MSADRRALLALFAGACAIGFAPILVRYAQGEGAGSAATAFWRVTLALPLMALLAARSAGGAGRIDRGTALAGLMFGFDLACWHYGIRFTSVANATVLSNLTPILVTGFAWLVWRERPQALFLAGMALAVGGAVLMGVAKGSGGQGSNPPLGDLLSALTAVFYGGYFLAVRQARRRHGALRVMLWSGVASAPVMLALAMLLHEPLLPASGAGWAALAGLALMHVVGQGLIAWSLGRLPTALAAVVVLVQPVVAAGLGFVLFGEAIAPWQGAGAVLALAGVALAQLRPGERADARTAPEPA